MKGREGKPGYAPEKEQEAKVKSLIEKMTKKSNAQDVMDLFKKFSEERKQELIALPEIQAIAKTILIRELGMRRADCVTRMITCFNISEETLKSEELQKIAKTSCIESLKKGGHDGVFRTMKLFHLPDELLASEEFINAAMEGIDWLLSKQCRPMELADEMANAFAEKGLGHLVYRKDRK